MIVALVGGGRSEIADARYGRLCPRSGLPFRSNGTTGALQRGRLIVPPQNCKAARSTVLVGHRPCHFCGTNAYFLVWIVVDPPNSGYAAASINSIPAEHWPVGLTAPTLCLPADQSPDSEMMPQVFHKIRRSFASLPPGTASMPGAPPPPG